MPVHIEITNNLIKKEKRGGNKMRKLTKGLVILLACVLAGTTMAACGVREKTEEEQFMDALQNFEENFEDEFNMDWQQEETVEENMGFPLKEEEVYHISKEIQDAPFNSCKIQIGDEIFEEYGYTTLQEFYDKYSNDYWFGDESGLGWPGSAPDTYTEDFNFSLDTAHQGILSTRDIYMQKKNSNIRIHVTLSEPLSYDTEFLHYRDMIVDEIKPDDGYTVDYAWYPGGLACGLFFELPEEGKLDCSKEELVQFLESKGLSENPEIQTYQYGDQEGYYYNSETHTMCWVVLPEKQNLNAEKFSICYSASMNSTTERFDVLYNVVKYEPIW